MGINGLLPVLKPICEPAHVKAFSQQRVGIDASSWLHKGAFGCALELATGAPTSRYVDYCMHRVRMLIHFGAIPVLVFDGAPLPLKAGTNSKRRQTRTAAKDAGNAALRRGDSAAARDQFQRGIEVTHEMARAVIREIRKLNVEYYVAPYEADAQLAWLSLNGHVDVVITEDSDLVVYGVKKILYKMGKTGDGELYQTKNLMGLDEPNMRNFTHAMFTWVCVFSGCDFFPGVNGLGIRKAHTLVQRSRTLTRVLQVVRYDTKYTVASDFADHFVKACMAFRHQTVFNPLTNTNQHLTSLDAAARSDIPDTVLMPRPGAEEDLSFLGSFREEAVAVGIANGTIHPVTLTVYAEPLDVVERPMSQNRAPSPSEPRKFGTARISHGLAVSKAGKNRPGRSTAGPVFRMQPAPVSSAGRRSLFFTSKPRIATESSPAVSGPFKAPNRVSTSPEPDTATPKENATSKNEWMKRSLSTLNPGHVPLRHLKRATSNLGKTASTGKRQRTILDLSKRASAAKAASRFADSKSRNTIIHPYALASSAADNEVEPVSSPSGEEAASDDGLRTPRLDRNVSDASDPASSCPPSPDSDAYDKFEAIDEQENVETNPFSQSASDLGTPSQIDPGRSSRTLQTPTSVSNGSDDDQKEPHGHVNASDSRRELFPAKGPIRIVSPFFSEKRLSLQPSKKSGSALPSKETLSSLLKKPQP